MPKLLLRIFLAISLLALVIGGYPGAEDARAAGSIRIYVDDVEVPNDVPIQEVSGRLLVPLRSLGEALGCEVTWDGNTQTAILEKNDTIISLTAGSVWASVGGQVVAVEPPPQIVNSRMVIPLRFIGENLGCTVNWDASKQEVRIYQNQAPPISTAPLTDSDYITYCNLVSDTPSFQFDYPQSFIKLDTGDKSITFTSPDYKAILEVWQQNNPGYQNISDCYTAELDSHSSTLIYERLQSEQKWFVLGWTEADSVVYCKTYFTGTTIVTARFRYNSDSEQLYQPVLNRIFTSFQLGKI